MTAYVSVIYSRYFVNIMDKVVHAEMQTAVRLMFCTLILVQFVLSNLCLCLEYTMPGDSISIRLTCVSYHLKELLQASLVKTLWIRHGRPLNIQRHRDILCTLKVTTRYSKYCYFTICKKWKFMYCFFFFQVRIVLPEICQGLIYGT